MKVCIFIFGVYLVSYRFYPVTYIHSYDGVKVKVINNELEFWNNILYIVGILILFTLFVLSRNFKMFKQLEKKS